MIQLKKKQDNEKIKEIFDMDLNNEYDVQIPEEKNPRMKIVGLDEKPLNDNDIIETIKRQNDEFFDEKSEIKVVTTLEMKNTIQYTKCFIYPVFSYNFMFV